MAATSRRSVITGIGIISPLGCDADSFGQSLKEGRSGIRRIQAFDPSGLPVQIAGEVPDFDPKQYVEKSNRRNLRMMARTIHLAVAGAQRALEDGAVDKSKFDKTRFGVEFGSGLIASELPDLADAATVSTNCQPGKVDLEKWGLTGPRSHPAAYGCSNTSRIFLPAMCRSCTTPKAQTTQSPKAMWRPRLRIGRGLSHPDQRRCRFLPRRRRGKQNKSALDGPAMSV